MECRRPLHGECLEGLTSKNVKASAKSDQIRRVPNPRDKLTENESSLFVVFLQSPIPNETNQKTQMCTIN